MAMSMASVPSCSCAAAATATAGGLRSAPTPLVTSCVVRLKSSKDSTPWYSESVSCSQKNWRHHHVRRRYIDHR
ncbi:hypothetical protein CY35_09G093600 [Sphagnum magellanicum]|nr:hypothetical protein CY35_09G093600 [Sphagnum magellanicum]